MSLLEVPPTVGGFSVGDTAVWTEDGEIKRDEVRNVDDGGVTTPTRRLTWSTPGLRREPPSVLVPAEATEITGPLTEEEAERLSSYEETIRRGLGTFRVVGQALALIRDQRLYRETHETWEDYCREKWELSRAYAYQVMAAAEVHERLTEGGVENLPATEGALRPLAGLEPDQQVEAGKRAAELAGDGKVTSAHTAQAADEARFDYGGWELDELVWAIDGAENVRHGVVKRLWGGRIHIRSMDGGRESDLIAFRPDQIHGLGPDTPPATPFGVCQNPPLCKNPAVPSEEHEFPEKLCKGCLAQREAAQRVADMAAAAGVPEITGQLITSAGVEADPAEEVPETALSAADQAAEATPPAESTPTKPRALMGAEEIRDANTGSKTTVPSTIGAAVLEGPVQMCMVLEDCVSWIASDGLVVKTFLGRLKAAAFNNGLSAAELLTRLETPNA